MSYETRLFLSALFACCQEGYITLSAIHPDGRHHTPSRHIPTCDNDGLQMALADLLKANEQGWGAFYGVATRSANLGRWRRGGQNDLRHLPGLFVDLDVPVAEALQRLRAHDPPPSCVISSGGGAHAYWWLDTPTSDWRRATQALQQLRQQLGADKSSVAQSMRLVGPHNTKPQRHNAPCCLLDLQSIRYPLACFVKDHPAVLSQPTSLSAFHHPHANRADQPYSLNHRLIAAVEAVLIERYEGRYQRNGWLAALCPCGHHRDAPGMHFAYVESKSKSRGGRLSSQYPASLPKTTLEYLTYGASVGQRNAALFAAACQFRDAGYSIAEATSQLVSRYLADGEAHESSGTRTHEARRTIQSAYTRPPRGYQTG
jgi:hypothetical protein